MEPLAQYSLLAQSEWAAHPALVVVVVVALAAVEVYGCMVGACL